MKNQPWWLLSLLLVVCPLQATPTGPFNYYQLPPNPSLLRLEQFHFKQAQAKEKQHQLEYAWNEFAFMLYYFPNHPQALQKISELSIKMKQAARALPYFEHALALYPQDPNTHELYSKYLQQIGKHQEARHHLQKAASLDKAHQIG